MFRYNVFLSTPTGESLMLKKNTILFYTLKINNFIGLIEIIYRHIEPENSLFPLRQRQLFLHRCTLLSLLCLLLVKLPSLENQCSCEVGLPGRGANDC